MRYFLLLIFLFVGCGSRENTLSISDQITSSDTSRSEEKTVEELAEKLFTLRADPLPQEWKFEQIDQALSESYRDYCGEIHILAWAKFQDKSDQDVIDRSHLLVLKKVYCENDEANQYALAHVVSNPEDGELLWRVPTSSSEGLTSLHSYTPEGHYQKYEALPSDYQVAKFLEMSRWGCRPRPLGPSFCVVAVAADGSIDSRASVSDAKPIEYVSSFVAGGVDREIWHELFHRRVPVTCFMGLAREKVTTK